ncbi:MAG: signal peptidase I [Anaerolineales bacterium]|nr:signal peptidase I [Anaerolineales bacterium]MCX7753636.1 signal peptidase I [Anaerolineales bacterium]MDW8277714.1 signal peptidase I [Anaerolineales bacterium]
MEELNTQPALPQASAGESAGWGRFLLDVLETLLLSAALFLVINALSARVRVDGSSMLPTLHNGEFVLVNRIAYRFETPQRGDIVVFHYPPDPSQDLIKRVIGLPGEEVTIQDGVVRVNGEPLVEPYISEPPLYAGTWLVPEGHLFVLGDNRNDSSDSHSWGMLPYENIVGKAVLIYWPFENLQLIDHHDFVKATHD